MREIDKYRSAALKGIFTSNTSFRKNWKNKWGHEVSKLLSGKQPNDIFSLGDELSNIFSSISNSGRGQGNTSEGQGNLSSAGSSWECLIVWYLNLVAFGSDVIILKSSKKYVPKPIYEASTVNINNCQTNSEADIFAFSIPNGANLKFSTPNQYKKGLEDYIRNNTNLCDLTIIQCKTNWNDNAQTPMLWDLIYNQTGNKLPNINLGVKGLNTKSFRNFSYAFCTVPTQKKAIKENSIAVHRVRNLSGGNYWGHSTKNNVASSIAELLQRNFIANLNNNVTNHISTQIQTDNSYINEFLSLNFQYK